MAAEGFLSVRVSTWSALYGTLRRLDAWLFRGQADATWPLATTFQRHGGTDGGYMGTHEREMEVLMTFYSRAHHYPGAPTGRVEANPLEWAAHLRHYGGPSRLLDVSRSPYVSAFFALEDAQPDRPSAVWAIRPDTLWLNGREKFRELDPSSVDADEGDAQLDLATRAFDEYTARKGWKLVVEGGPLRINERMAAQQGTFLIPLNSYDPFEESLFGTFGMSPSVQQKVESRDYGRGSVFAESDDPHIVKIVIEPAAREESLRELAKMNITAATLLPGLDGYARSLVLRLKLDLP